jgi:hypothetical protein
MKPPFGKVPSNFCGTANFDHDKGAGKGDCRVLKQLAQASCLFRVLVGAKPEQNDASRRFTQPENQLTEIFVFGQQYALL